MIATPATTRASLIAGLLAAAFIPSAVALAGIENSPFAGDYDSEPIGYASTATDDPVSRLQRRIDAGHVRLEYDDRHGYLRSLLRELGIDPASQVLVFSKTSFQLKKIAPHRPRAVYFSEDAYIGWVQDGEVIELAAVDADRGPIFYTLDQRPSAKPRFVRDASCLQCHAGDRTLGVPGVLVRSIYPDADGFPMPAGGFNTDHRSPVAQRWGGWYVSGTHGEQRHMGNAIVRDPDRPDLLDMERGANLTDLSSLFDTAPYLTPHSDIAALMVLEHQVHMQNLLTRANFEVRSILFNQRSLNQALNQPADELSEQSQQRIREAGDAILRYMLMLDEECLEDPIVGGSGFAERFSARGPRDGRERSLRQIDLRRFMFKYPCSYMIYSPSFDHLPAILKDYIYHRLYEVLTGAQTTAPWSNLSTLSRQAILEILRDTKAGLPELFHRDRDAASTPVSMNDRFLVTPGAGTRRVGFFGSLHTLFAGWQAGRVGHENRGVIARGLSARLPYDSARSRKRPGPFYP